MIWKNGKMVNDDEAGIHPMSHGLHYSAAPWEGIRFYVAIDGRRVVFRLEDHVKRLFASAGYVKMRPHCSAFEVQTAVSDAIKHSGLREGYVRPILLWGEGLSLGAWKDLPVETRIQVFPWRQVSKPQTLMTSNVMRTDFRSTRIEAKVSGNYLNVLLALQEATEAGFDDALLLDHKGNVAEATTANVFFVKGSEVFTPARGNFFPGLTRSTLIAALAEREGIIVAERKVSQFAAHEADAAFLVGTAAEVLPVRSLDGVEFAGHGIVTRCQELYRQLTRGEITINSWLTYVD